MTKAYFRLTSWGIHYRAMLTHSILMCPPQNQLLRLRQFGLQTDGVKRLCVLVQQKVLQKAGVAILTSDKIDFKTKTITRDKEGHYIMIKGSIQEEDITIVNIYAPNIEAPQYIRQILTAIKGESNSNTIIVGDFFFFL